MRLSSSLLNFIVTPGWRFHDADYDCPISEAGAAGQPGIGGPSKFDVRKPTNHI